MLLIALAPALQAQNMWMWNQRTHPELQWQTLETEHFNIHFHLGIESIAEKGARIAEQSYQPILDQLMVKDFGKTDIVFSAEDEIMNGFAMPSNQIFIWVSQNDVAGNFGGSDKWLKMVITHEFQHIVQFQAHRTWAGIWAGASIPAWWIEGMAEYMTEVWRVGRSDSRMKIHTYRNTMNRLDAHDDGYAKVLYLAWKYGDSTLVNISNHRLYLSEERKHYPYWYDFKTAFEKSTGQSLNDFNEEWRRVMNTYYYGYKAQKETIEEVGEPLLLKGFAKIQEASLAPDSSRIAVIGRRDSRMRDYGLYVVNTDSLKKIKEVHYGRFNGRPAWSPDGQRIVVAEYHRGNYGSLLNDLRLIDLHSGKKSWLTEDLRALHPVWSKGGAGVFFVAHPGETTQIYFLDLTTSQRVQLSQFEGDVQVQSLDLSPDGNYLAFMIQDVSGDVNIATLGIDGTQFRKITDDPEEDLYPVWTKDGTAIIFTSYRNSTPNLYRVELDSLSMVQMTDVAEGIYSRQMIPQTGKILASTLADVDTIRIRSISPDRIAPELPLVIREPFLGWRSKTPDIQLPLFDDDLQVDSEIHPYRARKTFRTLYKLIYPMSDALFAMVGGNDALGKHVIQGALALPYDGQLWGGYFGYINLEHRPMVSIYGTKGLAFWLQQIDSRNYVELRDGFGSIIQLPLNSGNSLSSNHSIQAKISGVHRELRSNDPIDVTITSADTKELNLAIEYSWKSQRPHTDAFFLPRDGHGVLVHGEKTAPEIWGSNDYWQYWAEGFVNLKVPRAPLIWFNRLKYVGQGGDVLDQDALSFSEQSPFYYSTPLLTTIRSTGLFDAPEVYNLRGQKGAYPGDELLYFSSELRFPLFKRLPLNIFGFGLQNFTANVFYDYGYIPQNSKHLETAGGEIRFDVSLSDLALVTLAYGWGGDKDYWSRDAGASDFWGDSYLRMALVNPF